MACSDMLIVDGFGNDFGETYLFPHDVVAFRDWNAVLGPATQVIATQVIVRGGVTIMIKGRVGDFKAKLEEHFWGCPR